MLSLLDGKAQSSLLILAILVAIFILGWVATLFLSVSLSARVLRQTLLAKISKYLDYIKGFSRTALLFSVHSSTKIIASQGGEKTSTGLVRSWICDSDISPSLESVRFFLSEETKNYTNDYLLNLRMKDLPYVFVENFTCIDYDVDSGVFSGKNDEKFNVSGFGSWAYVFFEGNNVSSKNEHYLEINQNRFWLMYRKFKEWAPIAAQILVGGLCQDCLGLTCNCPPISYEDECKACDNACPEFYACLENLVASANKILNDSFDEYVNCKGELKGCYYEVEPCQGSSCQPWIEAPKCRACSFETPGTLCSKSIISPYSFKLSYQLASQNCDELKCYYWAETRGSFEAEFSCTDYKYLLSVEQERHLTFNVGATVFMKERNCEREIECEEIDGECKCKEFACTTCV